MTPLEQFKYIVDNKETENLERLRRALCRIDGAVAHSHLYDFQPRPIESAEFHVIPCQHGHQAIYDDYLFFLVDSTWQISAARCLVRHGLRWNIIIRLLESLTGVDLRFIPKWNTKRLSKRISETAEIPAVKQVYLDARNLVNCVPSYPRPPRPDDLLVTTHEWENALRYAIDLNSEKLNESANKRAQQEKKEMLLWILTAKQSVKVAKKFLKTGEENNLEAFQSLQRALKHRRILPIS